VKPYYQDNTVTIYHGDCREILPDVSADAAITDPPYGLDFKYASYDDTRENWFQLMMAVVPLLRQCAPFVVMPCSRIDRLGWWYANHPPTWLIAWYKGSPGHRSFIGFNDWEPHLAWGKPPGQMHDYFQVRCGFEPKGNGHPCPKPIDWALWLIERATKPGGVVVDPFMGSGTTIRAAKDTGRRSIGIEIEERYCEVAAKRMAQEVFDFGNGSKSTELHAVQN
jgi:site-specific DNA-methyltransferase (adenine-specific)